ncbi:MAG: hypothetical protein M3R38_11255 [Actinomycetota bacterium]|nr:hypothetical protein [Actinomycetota bacterium]
MTKYDTEGFRKFKERRAETTPKTADDELYERFVSSMTGQDAERQAGVAQHLEPGVPVPETLTDDAAYEVLLDVISGKAARRQALEDVRRDRAARQEEHRRHAQMMGTPLPEQYED